MRLLSLFLVSTLLSVNVFASDYTVQEIAPKDISTIDDAAFKNAWTDLQKSGGAGRVFMVSFSQALLNSSELTYAIFEGPVIFVTKPPQYLSPVGTSIYNHDRELLEKMKTYTTTPVFLLPVGRKINGAATQRQFPFLIDLYEKALPNKHVASALVITPSTAIDTFVHESTHLRHYADKTGPHLFMEDVQKVETDADFILRLNRFSDELSAYIEHLDFLEELQKTRTIDYKLELSEDKKIQRVVTVPFNEKYAQTLERIYNNLSWHGQNVDYLMSLRNPAGPSFCNIEKRLTEFYKNRHFDVRSIITSLALSECR